MISGDSRASVTLFRVVDVMEPVNTDPPSESPRATVTAAVNQVDSAAECKTLFAQFLSSLESGEIKIPPPKPKSENSWSRNKDRKNQRKNQGKPRQDDQNPKVAEQTPHQDDDGDASAEEDQPAVRQRIKVIRAQTEPSSDEESDLEEALDPLDLRTLLKRKITSTNNETPGPSDLRVELNAKRTKHALSQGPSPASTGDNPIVDLRDQLNARIKDLRTKLDRKPRQDDQKPKVAEQTPHQDDDGDASAEEDQPAVRQRIEVICAQPEPSSDEESDLEEALDPLDLRTLLKRKITSTNNETPGPSDL
ncbi:hypothetical protein DY000_02054084 [Brassica cretica]|uniref:Plus3 domain-containing protein n=1 Tax=Brassica cretica TaxID=69181 RepID=A0ABQ7ALD5_BRACR|nr:hypothetical protein DY000_02054084 [Brassica cretica]